MTYGKNITLVLFTGENTTEMYSDRFVINLLTGKIYQNNDGLRFPDFIYKGFVLVPFILLCCDTAKTRVNVLRNVYG